MLISILGFGSIWSRRVARLAPDVGIRRPDAAYYNTTGVPVGARIRNRPRVYGVARFNANSGFRPDWLPRMISKVFDCEPPSVWGGHNTVLFKRLLNGPEVPAAYLVTVTAEQVGRLVGDTGAWLHDDAQLISFSECGERQELMLVMPAYAWLRGTLGTFFLEPSPRRRWIARLVLSPRV